MTQHDDAVDPSSPQLTALLAHLNAGLPVDSPELHQVMVAVGNTNRMLTCKLNNHYLDEVEIRTIMSRIVGYQLDKGFRLFPPFTTDFGRNIHIGANVFINSGARFQDQGGITIGEGCLIGHNAVITTLNHDYAPAKRHIIIPRPVHIGTGVWLGANVTVLPGVTIGDNAVVAAGAVVTKDVPERALVAGAPARFIRNITED